MGEWNNYTCICTNYFSSICINNWLHSWVGQLAAVSVPALRNSLWSTNCYFGSGCRMHVFVNAPTTQEKNRVLFFFFKKRKVLAQQVSLLRLSVLYLFNTYKNNYIFFNLLSILVEIGVLLRLPLLIIQSYVFTTHCISNCLLRTRSFTRHCE